MVVGEREEPGGAILAARLRGPPRGNFAKVYEPERGRRRARSDREGERAPSKKYRIKGRSQSEKRSCSIEVQALRDMATRRWYSRRASPRRWL